MPKMRSFERERERARACRREAWPGRAFAAATLSTIEDSAAALGGRVEQPRLRRVGRWETPAPAARDARARERHKKNTHEYSLCRRWGSAFARAVSEADRRLSAGFSPKVARLVRRRRRGAFFLFRGCFSKGSRGPRHRLRTQVESVTGADLLGAKPDTATAPAPSVVAAGVRATQFSTEFRLGF